MGHPALENVRKRRGALASRREIEREAMKLVAHPVESGVLVVEDVHLHSGKVLPQELADRAEPAGFGVHLERRGIGREDLPAFRAHALATKEHLRGPCEPGIAGAFQHGARDDLRERIDEYRRDVDLVRAKQVEIAGL